MEFPPTREAPTHVTAPTGQPAATAARGYRQRGFTLVELAVVIAIVGVMAALSTVALGAYTAQSRAKSTARSMADLILQARGEAIRTGVQHAVFFNTDPTGAGLVDGAGNPVAAIAIRDDDGDGKSDAGELVGFLPLDATGTLNWGVTMATEIAPGDPNSLVGAAPASPWAFAEPGGGAASWLVYFPDGTPRAYSVDPFVAGGVGTGGGAVYITANSGNHSSDYAVVLAPLGGIRLHAWDRGTTAWRN